MTMCSSSTQISRTAPSASIIREALIVRANRGQALDFRVFVLLRAKGAVDALP